VRAPAILHLDTHAHGIATARAWDSQTAVWSRGWGGKKYKASSVILERFSEHRDGRSIDLRVRSRRGGSPQLRRRVRTGCVMGDGWGDRACDKAGWCSARHGGGQGVCVAERVLSTAVATLWKPVPAYI